MRHRQARLGDEEFKSASVDVQGDALTDHIQGHNKTKAISSLLHHADHAGQRARGHANPVSFGHEWMGLDAFARDYVPQQFHIGVGNRHWPSGVPDGA